MTDSRAQSVVMPRISMTNFVFLRVLLASNKLEMMLLVVLVILVTFLTAVTAPMPQAYAQHVKITRHCTTTRVCMTALQLTRLWMEKEVVKVALAKLV